MTMSGNGCFIQIPSVKWSIKHSLNNWQVANAIGTGWSQGIGWTDIEVVRQDSGKPTLRVAGRAQEIADQLGGSVWHVSLSHTDELAIASVILESQCEDDSAASAANDQP